MKKLNCFCAELCRVQGNICVACSNGLSRKERNAQQRRISALKRLLEAEHRKWEGAYEKN
ncbi:hypothetical protein AAIR98_001457 [Elusimicrobium simillimum]|uniref:hypothetical protein n=1 Tax=Elusimicrobium simillimum TaxID=3143438 RepID=UPI003C6F5390